MENVDRAQKSAAYKIARKVLAEAGYGLTEVVLDASYFGVPQKRKRFFCVGALNQTDNFLLERIESGKTEKAMTIRDYFGSTLDIEYYYRHPRNYSRRAVFSIDEPAPTVRGVNRPIPQGYHGHPNDACSIEKCTRPLTTLERALVQTFPPDYKWFGSKTDMEQMIGNAVPVKLAEYVANALASHIYKTEGTLFYVVTDVIDYKDFKEWLSKNHTLSDRGLRDVVSRLKRALSICEADEFPNSFYRFQLEQSPNFKCLSPAVRSQIKKAVLLYSDYYTEKYGELKLAI
jgi:DNA (cytosine-5)-methyltransferase 1